MAWLDPVSPHVAVQCLHALVLLPVDALYIRFWSNFSFWNN